MGKVNPRTSNGHRRRQLRLWWKSQGLPCALCGQPIDYSLPAGNPMAFEVDEVIPLSLGGDPLSKENTQPTHRICNERKGNNVKKAKEQHLQTIESQELDVTRQWGF